MQGGSARGASSRPPTSTSRPRRWPGASHPLAALEQQPLKVCAALDPHDPVTVHADPVTLQLRAHLAAGSRDAVGTEEYVAAPRRECQRELRSVDPATESHKGAIVHGVAVAIRAVVDVVDAPPDEAPEPGDVGNAGREQELLCTHPAPTDQAKLETTLPFDGRLHHAAAQLDVVGAEL